MWAAKEVGELRGSCGAARCTWRIAATAVVLVLCAVLGFARAARAGDYFVGDPFALQTAIDDAASKPGVDTIHLAAGLYHIGQTTGPVRLGANDIDGPNGIALVGDAGAA